MRRPETGEHDEALAAQVAEAPERGHRRDCGEQVARQEPGGRVERGSELLLHGREDRDDHELLEPQIEAAEREDPGNE